MKQVSGFNFLRFYVETRYAFGIDKSTSIPIQKFLQKVARYYNVQVERNLCLGYEQAVYIRYFRRNLVTKIVLGSFDDEEKELLAFFHELGHHLSKDLMIGRRYLCQQSVEGMAWELGLDAAYRFGFEWEEGDPALQWAINCFNSYYVDSSSS